MRTAVVAFADKIHELQIERAEAGHFLCLLDTHYSTYFWYNIVDGSTQWVTADEVQNNPSMDYEAFEEVSPPEEPRSSPAPTYLAYDDEKDQEGTERDITASDGKGQGQVEVSAFPAILLLYLNLRFLALLST